MTTISVSELAAELHKPTQILLEQLAHAGVQKQTASDMVSEADKQLLLSYLQASHGTATGERKKITLTKKSTSEIKQADATGRARTIQVEVRKKRVFVQREEDTTNEMAQRAAAAAEAAELVRREEEARHQAELLRQQEEELARKRQERAEQEAREAAEQAAKAA